MKQRLEYNRQWSEYFQLDEMSPSGLMKIKNGWKNNIGDLQP